MVEFNQLPDEYLKPLRLCFDLLAKSSITFFVPNLSWYMKNVRAIIMKICVFTYFISLTVYLSRVFHRNVDIHELVYVFPIYTVTFQALLKGINITTKKDQLISLILELGAMWRIENINEVQSRKKKQLFKKIKYSYIACYRLTVTAAWQYMLAPLLQSLFQRFVLKHESRMLLPFACSFPFDTEQNWISYTIAYIFELFSMHGVIYYFVGTETLLITLTGLLSTEFVLLQDDFLNAKYVTSVTIKRVTASHCELKSEDILIHLIKRHQKLIKKIKQTVSGINNKTPLYSTAQALNHTIFSELQKNCAMIKHSPLYSKLTEQLDDIFNKLIFFNLSSSTIIITFFAVAAKVARGPVDMINNFGAVVSLLVPLFNLCYFSELLRQSSGGIADSAYNSVWYKGDKKYKKLLWFVIRRSQNPCSLTSVKYKPISLSTFSAVLSTTWSYFSLASSLYDDRN